MMDDPMYHRLDDSDDDHLSHTPFKRSSLQAPYMHHSINHNNDLTTNLHGELIHAKSNGRSNNHTNNQTPNQSFSRSQPLSRIHSPPKRKSIFRSPSSPDPPVSQVQSTSHDRLSAPSTPSGQRPNVSINCPNDSFVDRLLLVKNELSQPASLPPKSPTSIDLLDQSALATFVLNSPTHSSTHPISISESEWSNMSISQALSNTLHFHSPSLEVAFNQDYFQRYFISLRSTVLLCVAIWVLFSITDVVKAFANHQRKDFPLTISIRLGSAAIVAAIVLAAYRRSVIALITTCRLRWVIFTFIVLFGLCQTVFGVIEQYTLDPTYSTFVILIASMATPLFRLPFFMSVLCSIILWTAFTVATYYICGFGDDLSLFIATIVWLMGGIILSSYHAYNVEIGMRATFLQAAQLKFEEDQLAAMLARMIPKSAIKKTIPFVDDSINQVWVTDNFEHSTIMFVKIDAFDILSSSMNAEDVVQLLNRLFCEFDRLTEAFGAYKVETISNVYMVAGGVPEPLANHTSVLALLALAMMDAAVKVRNELDLTAVLTGYTNPLDQDIDAKASKSEFSATPTSHDETTTVTSFPLPLELKIGIHTGPVLAGVVGTKYPRYRLIHDTVNVASRMSTLSEANQIQLSQSAFHCLDERFVCQYRGSIPVKGKGNIDTYWLSAFLPCDQSVEASIPSPQQSSTNYLSTGPLSINEALGRCNQFQAAAEWGWYVKDSEVHSLSTPVSPGNRTACKHRRQTSAPITPVVPHVHNLTWGPENQSSAHSFIPSDSDRTSDLVRLPQTYGLYSSVKHFDAQSGNRTIDPSVLLYRPRESKDGHIVRQSTKSPNQSPDRAATQIIKVDAAEEQRPAVTAPAKQSIDRTTHHLRISTTYSPSRSQPNTPLLTPIPYPSDSFNLSISVNPRVSFSRSVPNSPRSPVSANSTSSDQGNVDSTNVSSDQTVSQSVNQAMLDESVWLRLSAPSRWIDNFDLSYSNIHLEALFQRNWSSRYLYQSMRGILVCSFAMLAFGIYDTIDMSLVKGAPKEIVANATTDDDLAPAIFSLQTLWLIRGMSLLIGSACMIVCWYHPNRFYLFHQPVIYVSWTIMAALQVSVLACKNTFTYADSTVLTRSLVSISGVASTLMLILSPSFFVGLQFRSVCIVCCTIVLFYLGIGLGTVAPSDMWITWYLVSAVFLSMRASHSSEKFERMDFYRARRLDLDRSRTRALYDVMLPPEIMKQVQQLITTPVNQSIHASLAVAHECPNAGVLFVDLVGFTRIAGHVPASRIVELLNVLFSVFDALTSVHRVYKVDTIGDAYLACSGVLDRTQRAHDLVKCALDFLAAMTWMPKPIPDPSGNQSISPLENRLAIRAGIHTGCVVAGVVGQTMLRYHLFGPTVTIAEEMEQKANTGTLAVTHDTYEIIQEDFVCKSIKPIYVQQQSINQSIKHLEIQRWEVLSWKGDAEINSDQGYQPPNHSTRRPSHRQITELVNQTKGIDDGISLNQKVRMILHRVRAKNARPNVQPHNPIQNQSSSEYVPRKLSAAPTAATNNLSVQQTINPQLLVPQSNILSAGHSLTGAGFEPMVSSKFLSVPVPGSIN